MNFTAYQCPETGTPLVLADEALIQRVNQAIGQQAMVTVDGQIVDQLIQSGWVSEATERLYPVRDQIISLLAQQALDLTSLPVGDPAAQ